MSEWCVFQLSNSASINRRYKTQLKIGFYWNKTVIDFSALEPPFIESNEQLFLNCQSNFNNKSFSAFSTACEWILVDLMVRFAFNFFYLIIFNRNFKFIKEMERVCSKTIVIGHVETC